MEIIGTLITLMPEQSGTGKTGNTWRKREFVIETKSQYPKKVCFSLWGDKIDSMPTASGSEVKVSFDVESREYNGRWYTEARAFKVESASGDNGGTYNDDPYANMPNLQNSPPDDLPF